MTHHAASRKMTLTIFAISLIAMSLVLCTYLLLSQETVPAQPFSVGTIEPNQEWPGALFSIHSDDQTIAYIEHRKGEDFLYLKNRLGATELIKELGRGSQNIQLAWSPNGKNLLVTWRDEVTKMHLFEFDANSASFVQEQVIIHDVRYLLGRIAWLSNSQIALSRSLLSDSHYHLYTLSLDTMEYQLFNSEYFHGDPYYVRHLASQNGYLAFVQNKNKKRHIRIFSPEGKEILTQSLDLPIEEISFLPQHAGLLITTERGIFTLTLDGSLRSLDLGLDGKLFTPQISSDGQSLYVVKHNANWDVWKKELYIDSNRPIPTVIHPAKDHSATCRFSSTDFSFISERSGTAQIWLHQQQKEQQLTQFTHSKNISNSHWSKDGQYLVFKDDNNMLLFSLRGHKIEAITSMKPRITPLGWDRQQEYIYYQISAEDSALAESFWRYRLSTGRHTQLNIPTPSQGVVSDGDLYYFNAMEGELHQWQTSGSQLIDNSFPRDMRFIAASNHTLFYKLPRPGQHRDIWAYDKKTHHHSLALHHNQYGGRMTDICNDQVALLNVDSTPQRYIYKMPFKSRTQP